MSNVIEVVNVCKDFQVGSQTERILNNINLKVEEGEFISIMGKSGSGKSTFLYLLGGLDGVTSGDIFIKGKNIGKMKDKELSTIRRQRIGFVFQSYNLIPNFTVKENILLPIVLEGLNPKKYEKKVDEILEELGILERKKYTPRELSGGQQQRVAIARALIHEPDIILADEPIGNLDSKSGTEIMELLQMINKKFKKTIVQVTHSDEAAEYGTKIIRVKDGSIM